MAKTDTRAIQAAHLLRYVVVIAERIIDGTDDAEPFDVRDDGRPTIRDDLHAPEVDELSKALPDEMRIDVLAAILEWREYLREGVDEAWFCLLRREGKRAANKAMVRAIEQAHQCCGALLRRLGARADAWWLVNTPQQDVARRREKAMPGIRRPMEVAILNALDGKAMKKETLAKVVCGGDASRLYGRKDKPGPLNKLMDEGLVVNVPGLGYINRDRPPPSTVYDQSTTN